MKKADPCIVKAVERLAESERVPIELTENMKENLALQVEETVNTKGKKADWLTAAGDVGCLLRQLAYRPVHSVTGKPLTSKSAQFWQSITEQIEEWLKEEPGKQKYPHPLSPNQMFYLRRSISGAGYECLKRQFQKAFDGEDLSPNPTKLEVRRESQADKLKAEIAALQAKLDTLKGAESQPVPEPIKMVPVVGRVEVKSPKEPEPVRRIEVIDRTEALNAQHDSDFAF